MLARAGGKVGGWGSCVDRKGGKTSEFSLKLEWLGDSKSNCILFEIG